MGQLKPLVSMQQRGCSRGRVALECWGLLSPSVPQFPIFTVGTIELSFPPKWALGIISLVSTGCMDLQHSHSGTEI